MAEGIRGFMPCRSIGRTQIWLRHNDEWRERGYYGVIAKLITGEILSQFLGGKLRGASE